MGLLWFRRSRPPGEKPAPAAEQPAAAPAPPPAADLRLRGLLLLNLKPGDGAEHIETAPPLGTRAEIVSAVEAAVPGIRFDADGRAELEGAGYRLRMDIGGGALVHAVVADVAGGAALDLLRALLLAQGWRVYAPRAGVFMQPDTLDLFAMPDLGGPHGTR